MRPIVFGLVFGLVFWLVLLFALVGCEDQYQENPDSCLSKLDQCDAEIVLELNERYCLLAVPVADNWDERWVQCEAFRRGQVCQCLGYECYDSVVEDLKTNGNSVEAQELLSEVLLWQCPSP